MNQKIQIGQSICFSIILFILFLGNMYAQVKITPEMRLNYIKNSDGSKTLNCELITYEDNIILLADLYVRFFTGIDSLIEVGSNYTNNKGIAIVNIPVNFQIPIDEEGFFRYVARFEGTDTIEFAESEVMYIDVNLDLTLEDVDSIHTIHVKASRISESGETIPVPEEDIYIYVPRMFGLLNIAEEWLDEQGEVTLEFPADLPGDSVGNISVVARFEEHDMFGTVEKRQSAKWGVPSDHEIPEAYRALWTHIAPTWMIITLTILLVGVWSHYIFVIYQLVKVRKEGKAIET